MIDPYAMQMQVQQPAAAQMQRLPMAPGMAPTMGSMPSAAMPGVPGMAPAGVPGMPGMPGMAPQGFAAPADIQARLGMEGVKPPSSIKTILKNVLITGGIGAVLGAGATMLPFIPGGAAIGAIVGGGIGAVLGLIRGIRAAKRQQEDFQAAMAAQTGMGPNGPGTGPLPWEKKSRKAEAPNRGGKSRKLKLQRHVVQSGESLSSIASKHGISWQKLYAANKKTVGSNPRLIHIGTKLDLPAEGARRAERSRLAKKVHLHHH